MSYKPDGYQDLIANMMFKDAKEASSYYETALGAEKVSLMTDENGWVMHGEMWVGDSCLFFGEEVEWFPRKAPTQPGSIAFYIYVPNVDASYKRAVSAGMTGVSAPETMFWGDRTAVVTDKYHYSWTFSTHVEDVSPEDMSKRQKDFEESM
ncbi:MAG: VOC family protein [Alphaproteobacteria bacterium]